MSISVLHIELGRHLYGGAKQVTYLIDALDQNRNFTQHLVCTDDSEISQMAFRCCSVHSVKYKGEADVLFVNRLMGIVKKVKPAIINVHSRRGADVWGAIIAKITGIPAVCTRRVDNPESRFSFYKYRQYNAVISISEGVQKVVSLHCEGVLHQKVIYSAVDIKEYSIQPNKAWLRSLYGIPDDHLIIANFAQYISRKGQADIILAMQQVIAKYKKVTCLLFGQGGLQESYQALIDRLHLQRHIKLCGFTQKVAQILPNIDIVVHPAYAEGLGVILLQAGASKCAVLSCPVGGIPEIIKHKETGVLVAPGDVDGIAERICELIASPECRRQYGEALYEHITSAFTIEQMATSYASLYTELVSPQANGS
ncbi:glycosyltransferase [Alteromonas sp. D210916BOD_24]|uniref:glycosyltransferase family 4 protein n=1 Tax=Alteromonas sp. D210916BOD_24 TaxID=3157618 RepID=UPI00399C6151